MMRATARPAFGVADADAVNDVVDGDGYDDHCRSDDGATGDDGRPPLCDAVNRADRAVLPRQGVVAVVANAAIADDASDGVVADVAAAVADTSIGAAVRPDDGVAADGADDVAHDVAGVAFACDAACGGAVVAAAAADANDVDVVAFLFAHLHHHCHRFGVDSWRSFLPSTLAWAASMPRPNC